METFGCKSFAKPINCCFLEFRAELFRLPVRKKSAGLSRCFLPLHGNNLKEIFLKSFCIFCGTFFRSFPIIEQEKFGRPVKTAFIVSTKSFWKKNSFRKQMDLFIIFRHWAGSFWLLVDFSTGMLELNFTCPKQNFNEEQFYFYFLFHFWTLSDFFDQFLQKKSPSCPNWILSFNGNFRVKVFCKTYKLFLFEYRAENFRLAVRKKSAGLLCCFLRLHGDFLKKMFLKSFCIFVDLFSDQFR